MKKGNGIYSNGFPYLFIFLFPKELHSKCFTFLGKFLKKIFFLFFLEIFITLRENLHENEIKSFLEIISRKAAN